MNDAMHSAFHPVVSGLFAHTEHDLCPHRGLHKRVQSQARAAKQRTQAICIPAAAHYWKTVFQNYFHTSKL
jgi:hypothetical protein